MENFYWSIWWFFLTVRFLFFCSTLSDLKAKGSKFVTTIQELSKIKLSRFRLEKWVVQ